MITLFPPVLPASEVFFTRSWGGRMLALPNRVRSSVHVVGVHTRGWGALVCCVSTRYDGGSPFAEASRKPRRAGDPTSFVWLHNRIVPVGRRSGGARGQPRRAALARGLPTIFQAPFPFGSNWPEFGASLLYYTASYTLSSLDTSLVHLHSVNQDLLA